MVWFQRAFASFPRTLRNNNSPNSFAEQRRGAGGGQPPVWDHFGYIAHSGY